MKRVLQHAEKGAHKEKRVQARGGSMEGVRSQNMGDYHDTYLRADVLLLADVIEDYRKSFQTNYGLDPAHFLTTPGFAWDALLKITKQELELLTDYDMHLFIEQGIRGGISTFGEKRYAKANNPYMKDYDPEKETSYIMYEDENNEYGWAMCQPMPVGDFKRVRTMPTEKEIMSWLPGRKIGFILEVDLKYPEELHELHNGYPLAPERRNVPHERYSPYQKKQAQDLNLTEDKTEKLLLILNNKTKYVVHYRNLQQYIELGLKLTRVHRVLSFTQKAWMEPLIRFNTEMRKKAKSKFEQNLYKLMNNSVFGKTMENLRNRVEVELVRGHEVEKIRKLISNPLFNTWRELGEGLFGIHLHKDHILFNRPIYVGMCVLDLSKLLLYEYYYGHIKPKYGANCSLLYTNTDSLLMHIKCNDFYKDMKENLDLYDTSNYLADHPCYSSKNKKIPGKLKDECAGRPINETICLRFKMYSIMEEKEEEKEEESEDELVEEREEKGVTKKAKGVTKCVVQKVIRHEDYKSVLFNRKADRHEMARLVSLKHEIYGVRVNKTSISPFDSKGWLDADGVATRAYGNKSIPNTG